MQRLASISVLIASLTAVINAKGAGRAFPDEAEAFTVNAFRQINPNIEWDETNFLVDVAGLFANCGWIGTRGFVVVDRPDRSGQSIGGIVDFTSGTETDVESVTRYITNVVNGWTVNYRYQEQVRRATKFGCSVRPGCSGQVSVGCLFSPGGRGPVILPSPTPPTTLRTELPHTTVAPLEHITITGEQVALAFTEAQYDVAEKITGKAWDKSHFLENLSGYETKCRMIDDDNWEFNHAHFVAGTYDTKVVGLYAHEPNRGSTPEALIKILESFKGQFEAAKQVGCSVIPDCRVSGRPGMHVVVGCVYSTGPANRKN